MIRFDIYRTVIQYGQGIYCLCYELMSLSRTRMTHVYSSILYGCIVSGGLGATEGLWGTDRGGPITSGSQPPQLPVRGGKPANFSLH